MTHGEDVVNTLSRRKSPSRSKDGFVAKLLEPFVFVIGDIDMHGDDDDNLSGDDVSDDENFDDEGNGLGNVNDVDMGVYLEVME